MAVAAINAEPGDMMLVAKGNGLGFADTGVGHKGRALNQIGDSAQCGNDKHCAENGGAGQRVRAAMKDLRHSLLRSG